MSSWLEKRGWRPKNCPSRYATEYEFPPEESAPEQVDPPSEEIPRPDSPIKGPWCAACMRQAFEPICLSCGHNFCRRCLAGVRHNLVSDFADAIKDVRAPLKCPLSGCRAVVRCLPFVNGDFRFTQIRPSDKVQCGQEEQLSVEEEELLSTYICHVDIDVSVHKKNSLFQVIKSSRVLYREQIKAGSSDLHGLVSDQM